MRRQTNVGGAPDCWYVEAGSRQAFEELGQGGDDVGGERFVVVLLFPFFAFEPNGLCAEGVGGDDVFGERIADGHTRRGGNGGRIDAQLPNGGIGFANTHHRAFDDVGKEVGEAVGAEHCADVAVEIGDQHKAVAAVAKGLQEVAGFVGVVSRGAVTVVGYRLSGGRAVRIGERYRAFFAEKGEFDGDFFVQKRAEIVLRGDDGLTGEGAFPVYVGVAPHFAVDRAERRKTAGGMAVAVEENEIPVARTAVERAAVVEE